MGISKLPVLAKLISETNQTYFKGFKLIILQHMLDDTFHFIKLLNKIIDIVAIFQIPYSSNKNVIHKLRKSGFDLCFLNINDESKIKAKLNELYSKYKKGKFIIHEIGGNFSFLCKPENVNLSRRVAGIVEDTTFGLRQYKTYDKYPFPIYHVAKSQLKKLEAKEVGFSIVYAIISDLKKIGILTKGYRVLVLGYGDIGSSTSFALRSNGLNVSIFDILKARMLEAKFDGYEVGDKEELLKKVDIVIGTTGEQSIGKNEINFLNSGTVIASGSSKQVEIDISFLEKNSNERKKISDGLTQYKFKDGKKIYLLRNGFPVNFAYESVPVQVLDLVMSEIYLCMKELIKMPKSLGLVTLEEKKHEIIADYWLRTNKILAI